MKRFLVIAFSALVALASSAQMLWKVSGNGLTKDSYILGTYHLVPASAMNMISGLDEALENCDIVVGESDYNEQKTIDGNKWYELPADSTLDQLYTPQEYKIVKKRLYQLAGSEFDLGPIKRCKPVRVLFEMFKMIAFKDYTAVNSDDLLDYGVMKRAVEMGRQSMGLDVTEEVNDLLMGMFSQESIPDQAKMLLEICKEDAILDQMKQMILSNLGAYMTQKLDWVVSSSSNQDEKIVINRNRQWVPKLVEVMPDKSCLVCVGAGHLPGHKGLLQLLRDRGYTVEPMK